MMNNEQLENRIELLTDAVGELADRLGNTNENPISLSLLCLDYGITVEQRDSIVSGFFRLADYDENLDAIALPKYRRVVEDALTGSQTLSADINNRLVITLIQAATVFPVHGLSELTDHLELGMDYDSVFDQTD